jgi:NDP-sugar pyrophosphorylase family protein
MNEAGNRITVGAGCTIDDGAEISDSVLWDRVRIESGARIRRCVLADGVRIEGGETLENSIVVPAALVQGKMAPQKSLKGRLSGENFVVSLSV